MMTVRVRAGFWYKDGEKDVVCDELIESSSWYTAKREGSAIAAAAHPYFMNANPSDTWSSVKVVDGVPFVELRYKRAAGVPARKGTLFDYAVIQIQKRRIHPPKEE